VPAPYPVDFDRQINHPENPIEPVFGTNMQ